MKKSKLVALLLACIMMVLPVVGFAGYELPLTEEKIQLTVLTNDLPSQFASLNTQGQEGAKFEILDRIEEMLGVDLVFQAIPEDDYATVLTTRLAANVDMPDIILDMKQTDANRFGQMGVILDLAPYLEKYDTYLEEFLTYEPDAVSFFKDPQGSIYSYNTILTGYEFADPYGIQIRGDWLEAAGMDYPTTIEDWDKLFAYWKANDMNGNGDPNDEICFSPRNKDLQNTLAWMHAWGLPGYHSIGWSVEDGKVVYDYVNPAMKECIKKLAEWYALGYIDKDFLNITNVNEKIAAGLTGATHGWANNIAARTALVQGGGWPEGYMIGVAVPKVEGYTPRQDIRLGNAGTAVAVTTACKHPDLAFKVVDWYCASAESMVINWFGFDGTHYEGTPTYQNDFWQKKIFEDGYATKDAYLNANGGRILFTNFRAANGPWSVFTDAYASGQSDLAKESMPRMTEALVEGFPNLQATLDEQDVLDMYLGDMDSYVKQTLTAFIMGEKDVETEWDNYVKQVNKLGLPEILEVKQAQYDRL